MKSILSLCIEIDTNVVGGLSLKCVVMCFGIFMETNISFSMEFIFFLGMCVGGRGLKEGEGSEGNRFGSV